MQNRKRIAWGIIAIFGLVMLLLSMGCLGLALVTTLVRTIEVEQRDLSAILLACTGLLGLGLAGVLLLSGVEVWLGRPSPVLYPRRAWLTLLAGIGFSVLGGALLATAGYFNVILAPFHVALIALPAFFLYALLLLAAGREARVTRRQAVVIFTSGALSTLPAIPLEVLGFVLSGMGVAFGALFIPGGLAELERLALQLQHWSQLPPEAMSPDLLGSLLASPLVLAVLLLTLAVITPLVEELVKTAGVILIGFRWRPTPLRAFLWGTVAGIGFAVIEGVLNSGMSLTDTVNWAAGVGSRAPATAMHAFVSGLIGLGWGYFWQGRKRWLLPLCYAIAIFFHGLWNFSVVAVAGLDAMSSVPAWLSGAVTVFAALIIGGLSLLALAGLIGIPLWLRKSAHVA